MIKHNKPDAPPYLDTHPIVNKTMAALSEIEPACHRHFLLLYSSFYTSLFPARDRPRHPIL